jgi:hypothetical protein
MWPTAGFHRRLVELTIDRFRKLPYTAANDQVVTLPATLPTSLELETWTWMSSRPQEAGQT